MNKRIRSMIDEIFSEMKMTAENLALRDELMANAQARYEDAIAGGASEEEAFAQIAASLEDVHGLLAEMNSLDARAEAAEEAVPQQTEAGPQAEKEERTEQTELGDALNKAFTALGDFSQALMPEAKKLYGQMDDVTGGVLGKLGRAARKGMKDAQKAAGEAIDRMSRENGELVFDFGKGAKPETPADEAQGEIVMDIPQAPKAEPDEAAKLRAQAQDLRAQASFKAVTGDEEGAAALNSQAEQLENQAAILEQAGMMDAAREAAARMAETLRGAEAVEEAEEAAQEPPVLEEKAEPVIGADGEVNEDAFARAVDQMAHDAQQVIDQAAKAAQDAARQAADYVVRDACEPVSGTKTFPAAGLHALDIQLDADDVKIELAEGGEIETRWEARSADGEPVIAMEGHTLTIRRKNPDVFKTFFSVFQKAGGAITVRVPRGYAAGMKISTTSGDVHIAGLDAGDVKVNTTSGSVRVEPDARVRAGVIDVTTVSGCAAVSACADMVNVTTVSGEQFISCDAHKVDVNAVSGGVHVEGACEEWEIDAVSADVQLLCTVAPTKKVHISTMSGSVRLALPGEIRGFAAEMKGAFGSEIVNEFGPNRYGTCGLPIRMDTMSGKLMITRL